jgi:hypothetical protein
MTILNLGPACSLNQAPPVAATGHERRIATADGLVVDEAESLNCERRPADLGAEVTPTAGFFRRSHFRLPAQTTAGHVLDRANFVQRDLGAAALSRPRD